METLKCFLKNLFNPIYWYRSYPYNQEWDDYLKTVIEKDMHVEIIDEYTAKIIDDDIIIWLANYPYASFHPYAPNNMNILPSRCTTRKFANHLVKCLRKRKKEKHVIKHKTDKK